MSLYYKPIKRLYDDVPYDFKDIKIGWFIAQGQWADGGLAYSRIEEDGTVTEECCYAQIRHDHKLKMIKILGV